MTDTIHSCSELCTRPGCVAGREASSNAVTVPADELAKMRATITAQAARIAELERENAELKAALRVTKPYVAKAAQARAITPAELILQSAAQSDYAQLYAALKDAP